MQSRLRLSLPCLIAPLLLLSLLTLEARADTIVAAGQNSINITASVSLLEDPDGTLTIDEVRRSAQRGMFRRAPDGITALNLGYTTSTYWIRFSLASKDPAPGDLLLEAAYFGLDELTLYTPGGKELRSGNARPQAERYWPHRYFIFPLKLEPGAAAGDYYLKVYSSDTLILPLVLWHPMAFIEHVEHDFILQGVYFGGVVSLFLYSMLMFGALKDRKYLLYAAFIGSTGAGFFFLNGYANLFESAPLISQYSTKSAFAAASIFATLFVRELLQTRVNYPLIHRILAPVIAVHFLMAIAPLLGIPPQTTGVMLSATLIPTVLLALLVAILSGRDNLPGAQYFLLAWTLFLIAALINSLYNFGLIAVHQDTMSLLQYSSAFDMLLLTISISQRVEADRKAKEDAVEKAAEFKEKMIRTLTASGERLEKEVRRRTQDLEDALMLEKETFDRYRKFDAMVTHEFRTPLAVIASQSQLALKELEHGIDNTSTNMEVIRQAAYRLNMLYTRMEEKDRNLVNHHHSGWEQVELGEWLRETAREMARASHHTIKAETGGEPLRVEAQPFLLRVAVTNLIDNAEKYAPPGSTIALALARNGTQATIRISSSGPAIPEAYREKIFEKHYRMPEQRNLPGRGLGLFIVRDIIETHNGTITHETPGSEGNAFCISIPLASSEA
ncbi:sensor histidine kinase [Chlorobium sp. N1]|uniref:sensor histidine kinase n=1 Tax=Chlorobium sp. N1 TaxID=2491138 RepID=UPI00103E8D3D|nr:sensor histidine kinase [Chlorobium sp. N1]TCD48602.1 hypothetical protein E0L29_01615 [Chlorobium sp. N1]